MNRFFLTVSASTMTLLGGAAVPMALTMGAGFATQTAQAAETSNQAAARLMREYNRECSAVDGTFRRERSDLARTFGNFASRWPQPPCGAVIAQGTVVMSQIISMREQHRNTIRRITASYHRQLERVHADNRWFVHLVSERRSWIGRINEASRSGLTSIQQSVTNRGCGVLPRVGPNETPE